MTEKLDRACALCVPLVAKGENVKVMLTQVHVTQEGFDFFDRLLGPDLRAAGVGVGDNLWLATALLPQEGSLLSFDQAAGTSDEAQDKLADAITTMLSEGNGR